MLEIVDDTAKVERCQRLVWRAEAVRGCTSSCRHNEANVCCIDENSIIRHAGAVRNEQILVIDEVETVLGDFPDDSQLWRDGLTA